MPQRARLLLLLGLLLAGCGADETPPRPEPPPPETAKSLAPEDPEEALIWVRAAGDRADEAELRRRLAAWPLAHEAFVDSEESQVVLTWRLRVALQDGLIEEALAAWVALREGYEGHGVSPEGRGLTPTMIRLGLLEEARLLTRRRIEGARPDATGALRAWKIGAELLRADDDEDRKRLAATHQWATVNDMGAWLRALEIEAGKGLGVPPERLGVPPERLGVPPERLGAPPGISRAQGEKPNPFVVVVADDFALGEIVFADVLRRWLRQGADARLRGVLVPIKRGQVRLGLRRVPVETDEEEITSLRERARAIGLHLTSEPGSGLIADTLPDGRALAKAMGLEGQASALLIVDGRGRIIGRLSGVGIDPRDLDPVIQKLVSR